MNQLHHPQEQKKNGFTLLETMIVLLMMVILILVTVPNLAQKERIIRDKGCQALLETVNSQILLYEIDNDQLPSSVSELVSQGYLKESQTACPDGTEVYINNGQADH